MIKKTYHNSLHEQITGKCVHFNGIMNEVCEAGVVYDSLHKSEKKGVTLPCLKEYCGNLTCNKREWPTEEQVQERLDEIEQASERYVRAGVVIADFRLRNRGKSTTEAVPCPACGTGTLTLSISGYNGHVWGKCTTDGCLAWME